MWKAKLVVLVLASVRVEGAAEPDPRGFTEDPLDTEEKFRENGKTEVSICTSNIYVRRCASSQRMPLITVLS